MPAHARRPFVQIAGHILLPFAGPIAEADARLAPHLTEEVLTAIAALIPEEWLADRQSFASPAEERRAVGAAANVLRDELEAAYEVRRAAAALDWHSEHGDCCQHLVFTSPGLDRDGLERLLESCLLTDAEYAAGRDAWKRLPPAFDTLLEV